MSRIRTLYVRSTSVVIPRYVSKDGSRHCIQEIHQGDQGRLE